MQRGRTIRLGTVSKPRPRSAQDRVRHRIVVFRALLILSACVLSIAPLSAQVQRREPLRVDPVPGIIIEPTAPIVNLFERAQEGIERRDWKFAIDSLQRIIDDPQGSLLPRDVTADRSITLYESARRRAVRRIASFPPEGLEAYRRLYDGQAKGLLDRARKSYDVALLRRVVEQFMMTRYGDDAVDLLASWLLDAGRPGEVVSLLEDLLELVPDFDVPEPFIMGKLLAARNALGQMAATHTVAEQLRRRSPDLPSWFERLTDPSLAGAVTATWSTETPAAPQAWSWSTWGGSPTRQGLMSGLSPTVTDTPPWSYALDGRSAYVWDRVHDTEAGDPLRLPVPSFAAVGDRLIVRQSDGCVALDMEDLAPIWTYPKPPPVGTSAVTLAGRRGSPSLSDAFMRYPSGSVTIAHGLAFIIERSGVGKPPPGSASENVLQAPQLRDSRLRNTDEDGRLIAIDIQTGDAVWERGRNGLIDDPLGRASIRSSPLAVDDELWTVYIDQRDLYVGILDPADGATISTISLCAMPQNGPAPGLSLELAASDGLVYVPTEYGVLFAVDAGDRTVRWAVRYGDGPEGLVAMTPARRLNPRVQNQIAVGSGSDASRTWLSSPPVVSGGLVLLAATDQEELLAFSSAFGTPAWSASADGSSYIIGADEQFVWLGGRSLSCLSLMDGSEIWNTALEEAPSGRAVVSGDVIHVPTGAGLISLQAETGQVISRQLIENAEAPLGNLLCTDAAMLSIEPSSVRKFPDTGGPYLAALEAHRKHPSAVTPALRLAWMQHLRRDSQSALDTLASIDVDLLRGDVRRSEAVARLQVEALMTLAYEEGGESALSRLALAHTLALTATDRVRTRLARSDRLVAMGRTAEAYETLLETAFQPESALRVMMTDRVTASTRLQIASRLATFSESLSASDARRISDSLRARTEAAISNLTGGEAWRQARDFLTVLTDLPVEVSLRVASMLALADAEMDRARYEFAEQLLLRALPLVEAPAQRVAVLMRLVNLTLEPTQEDPDRAEEILRDLESHYAQVPMTASLLAGAVGEEATTVGAWTRAVRGRLGVRDPALAPAETAGIRVAPTAPLSWVIQPPGRSVRGGVANQNVVAPFEVNEELSAVLSRRGAARMVTVHRHVAEGPSDRVLFHAEDDVVFCVRAHDGALLWHTTLRLPESFTARSGSQNTQDTTGRRHVVADGQIGVFNGRFGVFAVGLQTGRRLWYKPFEFVTNASGTNIRDLKMDARDGLLAAMPNAGRLTLIRLRDGYELWERDLRGASVSRVYMTDQVVVTIDARHRRAQFFERADGSLVGTAEFTQSRDGKDIVETVEIGHLLLGPSDASSGPGQAVDPGVVAYDSHTGREAWRAVFNKPIAALFDAGLNYLGVALLGGDVMVLRGATGEVAFTHRVAGVTSVVNGKVIETNLVVQAGTGKGGVRASELIALDIVTGAEDWRRSDMAGMVDFRNVTDQLMAPVLIDQAQGHSRGAVRLGGVIVDLRTGQDIGDVANVDANANNLHRFNGDFGLYDGALLVGFADGIQAYTTEWVEPPASDEGF